MAAQSNEAINVNDQAVNIDESTLLPLMVAGDYKEIHNLIGNDEEKILKAINVCNEICFHLNFKKLAEKVPDVKKSDKFTGNEVAKYGLKCLKRVKRAHLVDTDPSYENISFHLRCSTLKYLTDSAPSTTESTSFEAWSELIIDLVGNHDRLIKQLFYNIIHYKKNINLGMYFMGKYGIEYIRRLNPETEFMFFEQIKFPLAKSGEYYFPDELTDEKIVMVENNEQFKEMLEFFDTNKPLIIGIDSEWKPEFGFDEADVSESNVNKNKRADLLQIATRERTYLIEVRELVDKLDTEDLERFGDLVLFNDKITKLGLNFSSDTSRLTHCFSLFKDRFDKFAKSVIDLSKKPMEINRNKSNKETNKANEDIAAATINNEPTSVIENPIVEEQAGVEKQKDEHKSNSSSKKSNAPKNEKGKNKQKGLSDLAKEYLGKPLDKSETMSNWQNRPLRTAQKRYAALDAYVLIKIYDMMEEKLNNQLNTAT